MSRTVIGLGSLNRKLRKMPELVTEAAWSAIRAEVKQTASEVRANAPVDTGELVKSVRERVQKSGMQGQVAVTAEHAQYVNDGTRDMPARPFATSAGVQARARFPGRVREHLDEAVRKTARS